MLRALPSNSCWGGSSTPDPADCGQGKILKTNLFPAFASDVYRRSRAASEAGGLCAKRTGTSRGQPKNEFTRFLGWPLLVFARELAWRTPRNRRTLFVFIEYRIAKNGSRARRALVQGLGGRRGHRYQINPNDFIAKTNKNVVTMESVLLNATSSAASSPSPPMDWAMG